MSRRIHSILNRALPVGVRTALRRAALATIPTMRHTDMPTRLRHVAGRGFSPRVIADVGAASGEWARLAAGIWPGAAIIGFEPNARERANLERTKRELPSFDYRICFLGPARRVVSYSDRETQTSLFLGDGAGGATHTAEMRVLDELVAAGDVPSPDFLKLDVQGYELEVLKGAERALAGAQAVLMEVNWCRFAPGLPLVDEVVAFMAARGFVWYDVMGLIRRPVDDALWQMDAMFVRGDHPLRGPEGFDPRGEAAA